MSNEIEKRKRTPWALRLLAAAVCASALAGGDGLAADAEGAGKTISTAAKPARSSAELQQAQDRIHYAAALQEQVATTRWLARGAALLAFAVCGLGVWWLSARWLRYRFLQWLALIALPALVALAIFRSSQSLAEQSLKKLPRDWLSKAERDPKLSADPEQKATFAYALSLHDADETSLLSALALRPTTEIAGGALLLVILIWLQTHRRALHST